MLDFTKIIEIRDKKLKDHRRKEKKAISECNQARDSVQAAKKAVDDFAAEIKNLEVELINDLLNTEISITDIGILNSKLEEAEKKAQRLVNEHQQAESELADAEKRLEQIRQERIKAQSKLNKISELDNVLAEERREGLIAAEDAQMDAFVETMRPGPGMF